MKSKPPTKKAKLETASPSAGVSSSGTQVTEGKPKSKILNAIKEGLSSKAAAAAASASGSTEGQVVSKSKAPGSALTTSVPGPSSSFRLSFPILPSPEISKDFSRMSHVAAIKQEVSAPPTPHSTLMPMEDVEILQHELESLWSLLAVRSRTIKTESELLESLLAGQCDTTGNMVSLLGDHYDIHHQEKINTVKSIIDSGHGTRTSVSAAAKLVLGTEQGKGTISAASSSSSSSIVVGSNRKSNNSAAAATSVSIPIPTVSGRQPKKKLKAELGDKSKIGGNKPPRAGQNRSHSVSMDESFLRLEAPNQFWEFADSYCRDVTEADIEILTKEILEFREIPDATFSVPPLGKHFSGVENKNIDASARAREERDKKDVVGPLTQRLVTALVEDRVSQFSIQSNNGTREDLNGSGGGEFHVIPRPGLVKALGLDVSGPGTQIPLEARLKMVLAEQGYLVGDEAEDPFNPDQNDEVLAEIKRTFATLRKLHKHNLVKLDKLATAAKNELSRSPNKKELEKADKEIIAAYRAITACRIKRKPITQKERSVATKALQYRQYAIDKLTSNSQGSSETN